MRNEETVFGLRSSYTEKWEPKRARPVLGEIVNGARPAQAPRQSRTYGGCNGEGYRYTPFDYIDALFSTADTSPPTVRFSA